MFSQRHKPIYERSLLSWVFEGKLGLQLLLVVLIIGIVFLRVLPLEIQKRIVNDVLAVGDLDMLLVYCAVYLLAVLLSSALKLAFNGVRTLIGESVLTDIRREMYRHIVRLPLSFFRKTTPGSIVASLVTELAASANFIGGAIAVPLSNILTLLAIGGYLIWLNPLLGVTTLSIYPIALIIIPLVQRRVNRENKKRVDASRLMSSQITESITGINEVHAQGSFRTEERKYNTIIERLLKIRVVWSIYRYAVKVTNNLFVGLGPVVVLVLGGYLLMQGETELGSIVAFLSAQEKLYDPWKEMIDFYQIQQDAQVRYQKVMRAFRGETEFRLEAEKPVVTAKNGRIEAKDLEFVTTNGITLLEPTSFVVEGGEHLALVGFSGSGKSTLAKCIGQLYTYTGGELLLDGYSVAKMAKEEVIRSIGFISQEPFIFSGTIEDNLLYASRVVDDFASDTAGDTPVSLDDKIAALQQAGIFVDTLRFGLNAIIDEERHPGMAERFLRVRRNFQENFGRELARYVEFYRQDAYLYHTTVIENLIFGAVGGGLTVAELKRSKPFLAFLDSCNLRRPLIETGAELLLQTVDILGADVPEDPAFFEQTPIDLGEYEDCLDLAARLKGRSTGDLDMAGQQQLLDLAFRYIPARHKIIDLQPLLEKLILGGRKSFRPWSADHFSGRISFLTDDKYIYTKSILNNIFYGNLVSDSPQVEDRVNQCIVQLLIEEDLLEQVAEIGMSFDVGNRGDKLSGGQQQKLSIARVMLKKPKVLIMDEATSALDNKSQARIQNVVEKWKGSCTVIAVIHRLDILPSFDKVAVMKSGRIVEFGRPDQLLEQKGLLYELIHGKQ